MNEKSVANLRFAIKKGICKMTVTPRTRPIKDRVRSSVTKFSCDPEAYILRKLGIRLIFVKKKKRKKKQVKLSP
jgi:hypothetical protein